MRSVPGRLLASGVIVAMVVTSVPRIEAHAHAGGELSHGTIIHLGATLDHDHHAGHDHGVDQPHDGSGGKAGSHNVIQHLHLLPHAVALPPAMFQMPLLSLAVRLAVTHPCIVFWFRPEELLRPPIR